jgi:hypothetical protein
MRLARAGEAGRAALALRTGASIAVDGGMAGLRLRPRAIQ